MRLWDDRVLLTGRVEACRAVNVVWGQAQHFPVLAFRFADTHFHLVAAAPPERCGDLARRLAIGFQRVLQYPVRFQFPRLKPIHEQGYLANAVMYTLRQDQRHGLQNDSLGEGSNLPDLLGLRVLGTITRRWLASYLPRLGPPALEELMGIRLEPLRWSSAVQLSDAAASAVGLPRLLGRSAPAAQARKAAVLAVRGVLSSAETADLLGLSKRRVRQIKRAPPPPADLVAAIHRQLVARERLGERLAFLPS